MSFLTRTFGRFAVLPLVAAFVMIGSACQPPPACDWKASSGGASTYVSLDPPDYSSTPIDKLTFGNPFGDSSGAIARLGYTDFNGDSVSDVFRINPDRLPNGLYQWQYKSNAKGNWINLNASVVSDLSLLRFGDFNGDNKTDVFAALPRSGGGYQWMYSSGGSGQFQNIQSASVSPADLRVGDFNGDGKADVFAAIPVAGGLYQWKYSSGGTGPFQDLNKAIQPIGDLRFGDFDGNGTTDVFTATQRPDGAYQWYVSYGGLGQYQQLNYSTKPLSQLRFGDFDNDGRTDVFVAIPTSTGYHWAFSAQGIGSFQNLANANQDVDQLKFAYLVGHDLRTDVFTSICHG